jgi:hypothetical protein
MTDEGVGVWVYAITRAEGAADRTAGLRGVSEEPIRTVLGRDLAAVVGTVSLDVFRAASSPHDLKELDWSTAEVRAHNAVVRTVGRSGSVIPVPMATIYRDDWRVCQLLLNEYDDFRSALPRISGREGIRRSQKRGDQRRFDSAGIGRKSFAYGPLAASTTAAGIPRGGVPVSGSRSRSGARRVDASRC